MITRSRIAPLWKEDSRPDSQCLMHLLARHQFQLPSHLVRPHLTMEMVTHRVNGLRWGGKVVIWNNKLGSNLLLHLVVFTTTPSSPPITHPQPSPPSSTCTTSHANIPNSTPSRPLLETNYKDVLMHPNRSRSPPRILTSTHQYKHPFSVFAGSNHPTFLANPYSSLRDFGYTKDFDIEDPET